MMEQAVRVKCLIVTKNTVQFYASMDFPNMSYPFAPTFGYWPAEITHKSSTIWGVDTLQFKIWYFNSE